MNPRPPFVDRVKEDLLNGAGRYEHRRRQRRRVAGAIGAIAVVIAVIGLATRPPVDTIRAGDETADEPAVTTAQSSQPVDATGCSPGARPQDSASSGLEDLIGAYNEYDADRLVAFIGDGIVIDSSLEPGRGEPYSSLGAWLDAAAAVDDRLEVEGYEAGDPLVLHVRRFNRRLADAGASFTVSIWTGHSCAARVEVSDEISSSDP